MGHPLFGPTINPQYDTDRVFIRGSGGASPPAAPTLDSVTPGDTQYTAAWTPPAGSPDSYNLYESTSSPVVKATATKVTGVTSPYVRSGRTNGTTYYVAVTAVKGGLESVLSNEGSGTPIMAAFSITVQTTTTPQDYKLYLAGAVNLRITWGDTNENTYTGSDGVKTHSYATPGTYTITFVSGTATRIAFGAASCTPTLVKTVVTPVATWLGLTSGYQMFYGCTGITSWAPHFFDAASANLTTAYSMFAYLTTFNEDLGGWDASKIESLDGTWYGCTAYTGLGLENWSTPSLTTLRVAWRNGTNFNGQIGGWDVSGVTNMTEMLLNNQNFNRSLNSWDTAACETFDSAFSGCYIYNQSMSNWVTTGANATRAFAQMFYNAWAFNQSVSWLDTSGGTTLAWIFRNAYAFNQDVSGLCHAGITDIQYAFSGATVWNQDVSAWVVTGVTTASNFAASSAFAKTNYDLLLVSWAAQGVKNSVPFHAGTAHYSAGDPTTAHDHLTGTHSWTITDGGTP